MKISIKAKFDISAKKLNSVPNCTNIICLKLIVRAICLPTDRAKESFCAWKSCAMNKKANLCNLKKFRVPSFSINSAQTDFLKQNKNKIIPG